MSAGGDDYEISSGAYSAVVTQVGAGLRLLRHGDRDLVLGYDAGQVRPRYRGALLAPWPNRVVDGRYVFDGEEHQLDLSEPTRRHAIHGLVAWERFEATHTSPSAVTLTHRIVPRTGYPFPVELTVGYAVDGDGLTCTVTARNTGDRPAPYGTAPHPYLLAGPDRVDDWTFTMPAARVLEVTPDRLVPRGVAEVGGTPYDFRRPRRLERTALDHAFTGLAGGPDGLVRARVTGDAGRGAEIAWDPDVLPWVQVHTADLPDPEETRRALAVEPMTCPPDAFNSGTDLVVLAPGAAHEARWTIRAV